MSQQNRDDDVPNTYKLDTASLHWREDDTPLAADYDDIYFAGRQGLEETEHVFLRHNHLEQRWRELSSAPANAKCFTIAETGFGTGLNFLAAWRLWRQLAPPGWQLHFISTEKHPLSRADLQRSLNVWPALESLAEPLIDQYPTLVPGHHTLILDSGSVRLHLLLGDALHGLEQLCTSPSEELPFAHPWSVNAWFLDGFAPAKNPSLWNEHLYRVIARLSSEGTTLATFTAVGQVRRGLAAQGFAMKKVAGFGSKREMLCGEFQGVPDASAPTQNRGPRAPWYISDNPPAAEIRHVAIIGGGLAGAHTAFALAQRGVKVSVLDSADKLASGASGNPRGMLYTKLSPQTGQLNRFTLAGFLFALRHYQQLQRSSDRQLVEPCGVMQLACSGRDRQLLEKLRETFSAVPDLVSFCDSEAASELAGIPLEYPAWFFPGAGWADPGGLCRALVCNDNIEVRLGTRVASLALREPDTWTLEDRGGNAILEADAVVIATAHCTPDFSQCRNLPIKVIRGQITQCDTNSRSEPLRTVLCHEGYLTPAVEGIHHLGATFDINDHDTSLRPEDHRRNLESLHNAVPGLFPDQDFTKLKGRAALRCASPDYLPLVGRVPVFEAFVERFAKLRRNAHAPIKTPGSYYPGLYLNICHGSRGLTSTPLCGEILAALIHREPVPLERDLQLALNPARFIIRDLVRNKI